MSRLRRWLTALVGFRDTHRKRVCDQFVQLTPLPEAARMTTGPKLKAKPRTIHEWTQQYGRRRA